MNQIELGIFIAKCRKEKGLTKKQLADKLNITVKEISKWECGRGLPDINLYETLCEELDITLNDFLAMERIKPEEIVVKTNKNLEILLQDYYKIEKQKKFFKIVFTIVMVCIIFYIITSILVIGRLYSNDKFDVNRSVITEISQYSKEAIINEYDDDLDSALSVFPEKITTDMKEIVYESSLDSGLFDTTGYILLEYTLDEENYIREIERLKTLSMTIKNYNGEEYTNTVLYLENVYNYPAYVTIDGFGSTYEYALIDSEAHRIRCIYVVYLDDMFKYNEYLKKEREMYNINNAIDCYSMYNHSFDGGNTYVEFND